MAIQRVMTFPQVCTYTHTNSYAESTKNTQDLLGHNKCPLIYLKQFPHRLRQNVEKASTFLAQNSVPLFLLVSS